MRLGPTWRRVWRLGRAILGESNPDGTWWTVRRFGVVGGASIGAVALVRSAWESTMPAQNCELVQASLASLQLCEEINNRIGAGWVLTTDRVRLDSHSHTVKFMVEGPIGGAQVVVQQTNDSRGIESIKVKFPSINGRAIMLEVDPLSSVAREVESMPKQGDADVELTGKQMIVRGLAMGITLATPLGAGWWIYRRLFRRGGMVQWRMMRSLRSNPKLREICGPSVEVSNPSGTITNTLVHARCKVEGELSTGFIHVKGFRKGDSEPWSQAYALVKVAGTPPFKLNVL